MITFTRHVGSPGIAIGPILFVIALLALLAAAIAASSGAFTGGTTKEKAKVMAAMLVEWNANIDNAFQRIRANRYSDSQISFEIPSGTLTVTADGQDWQTFTTNSNCTTDSCKVFMPSGGL